MKARTFTSVGALHPILFFAVVYVVVLFLSIFICSSLFYSFNGETASQDTEKVETHVAKQESFPAQVTTAAFVR